MELSQQSRETIDGLVRGIFDGNLQCLTSLSEELLSGDAEQVFLDVFGRRVESLTPDDLARTFSKAGLPLEFIAYVAGRLGTGKRHKSELKCLQSIEILDSDHPYLYVAIAFCFERLEQLEDALAAAKEATRRAPANEDAFYALGCAHQRRNEHEEAAVAFRRSLEIDSSDADFHYMLGVTLKDLHDWGKARESLQNALAIDRQPEYLLDLAKVEAYCGNTEVALELLSEINPDSPEASEAIEIAKQIRNESDTSESKGDA